jgi:Rod binding domain-containing protein
MSSPEALPPVNSALEPAWVRHGSAKTQQTYRAALAFEEVMVRELASSLGEAAGGEEGEGGEGQGPRFGAGLLSSMLPDALAQGVVSGGGLGLAAQLTRQLEGVGASATTKTRESGGTRA